MSGGLILYFQGLESLKESVKETSEGEALSLAKQVRTVADKTAEHVDQIKQFFYQKERIYDNDTAAWAAMSRSLFFSSVAASNILYENTILLIDHEGSSSDTLFYSGVWGDTFADGSQLLVHGEHGSFQNGTTTHNGSAYVPTYLLGREGEHVMQVYEWEAGDLYSQLQTINPRTGDHGLYTGYNENVTGHIEGSNISIWRSPSSWQSIDGNWYAFSELFSILVPPPAPHPWHRYKSVVVITGFLYESWASAFVEYSLRHKDTTVVAVNYYYDVVGASSTSHEMIPECEGTTAECKDVFTKVRDLPKYVQEGFQELRGRPYGEFRTLSLDGEEYFARLEQVYSGVELIWLRPISSVSGKVKEALILLIVFTLLVLCFDVVISAGEVFLIALPLLRLSTSIKAIGEMDTDKAHRAIAMYDNAFFMVKEMRNIMCGMDVV